MNIFYRLYIVQAVTIYDVSVIGILERKTSRALLCVMLGTIKRRINTAVFNDILQ